MGIKKTSSVIFLNHTGPLENNMSKNDKIQMPSSGAGITRYFDDYKSKIELKPAHVVILVIIVILVVVFLHTQSGFLG